MSSLTEMFQNIQFDNSQGDQFNKYFAFFPQSISNFDQTRYRQTPKFGEEYSREFNGQDQLPLFSREVLKMDEILFLSSFVSAITGPERISDRMSQSIMKIEFDETHAEMVPVGGVPTETASKMSTSTASFTRLAKGARIWNNMLNSPIGAFYLGMQVLQISQAINRSFFYQTIQTILRVQNKFLDWSVETQQFTKKNIADYYQRNITRWDIIRLKDNGLGVLLTDIDDDQTKYRGSSDICIIPLKAQSYLRNVKRDQREYRLVGDRTGGFQNKYNSRQPITEIQQNNVFILSPQFRNDGTYLDHLIRPEQIGEWHGVYDRNYPSKPDEYTSNDITIKIYDQVQDSLSKISPVEIVKNSCVFDETTEGRVLPRETTFTNQSSVGSGFDDDKDNDFLSRPDGNPISLTGELRSYPVEHLVYSASSFKHRLDQTYYKNGNKNIEEIWDNGIEVWQWLQNQEYSEKFTNEFSQNHLTTGNIRKQRESEVFISSNDIPQLKQSNSFGLYDLNEMSEYVGLGSIQGMDAFSRINTTGKNDDIKKKVEYAADFMDLLRRLTKSIKKVNPDSKITDLQLNPLAIQNPKEEYSLAYNTLLNSNNFLWVDINAKLGAADYEIYVINTDETSENTMEALSDDLAKDEDEQKFGKGSDFEKWVIENARYRANTTEVLAASVVEIKNDIANITKIQDSLTKLDIETRLFQFVDVKQKSKEEQSDNGILSLFVDIRLAIFDALINKVNAAKLYEQETAAKDLLNQGSKKYKFDMRQFINAHLPSRVAEDENVGFRSHIAKVQALAKNYNIEAKEFYTFFGLNKLLASIISEEYTKDPINLVYDVFNKANKNTVKGIISNSPGTYLAPWIRFQFGPDDTSINNSSESLAVSPLYQDILVNTIFSILNKRIKSDEQNKSFEKLIDTFITPYVGANEIPFKFGDIKKFMQSEEARKIFGATKEELAKDLESLIENYRNGIKAVNKKVDKLRKLQNYNNKFTVDIEANKTVKNPLYVQTTLVLSPMLAKSLLKYMELSKSPVFLPSNPNDENTVGTIDDLRTIVYKIDQAFSNSEYPSNIRDIKKTINNTPFDFHIGSHLQNGGQVNTDTDFFKRDVRTVTKQSGNGMFGNTRDNIFMRQDYLPETKQHKLGHLSKEALAGMMSLFKSLSTETDNLLVATIARTLLMSEFTRRNLINMIKAHIPIPVEFVLYKPHMHYETYTLIKIQGNGAAILLYKGNPVFTIQNDAVKQEHYMQYSMTGGPFVVEPKHIYIQHNAIVNKSNGGASTKFYDPLKQIEDTINYYDPYTGRFGKDGSSMFVGVVPIGTIKKLPLDIDFTGHYHDMRRMGYLRTDDIKESHTKWLDNYRRCMFWGIRGDTNRKSGSIVENVNNRSPNFICHKAPTHYYSREKRDWPLNKAHLELGRSHWGLKGSLPGAGQFRNGQPVELKDSTY